VRQAKQAVHVVPTPPVAWPHHRARSPGIQILFALSFGLFNTLCFLCKRRVMKANDQRTVRVPSDDGKTADTKSVRAYDTEAIDLMMVKGTLVRPPHPAAGVHCGVVRIVRPDLTPPPSFPKYYGLALWSGSYRKAFTIMVVQGLSQPLQVLDSPVCQLHLRGGDENSEALERPWKAGSFLSNMVKLQSEWERRQEASQARCGCPLFAHQDSSSARVLTWSPVFGHPCARMKKRLNGMKSAKRAGGGARAGEDKKSS
jgi:hypothetical protein